MRPDHLDLLRTVSAPSLGPDGARAVVAVTRPDVAADAYASRLWQVPTDGSAAATPLTRGPRDDAPRHSPDGTAIAFLRSTPGGRAQVHVVPAAGGEPVAVTDQHLGVASFSWFPDGRRLVFAARVAEPGRYGTDPDVEPAAEPPRRITTQRYLANGLGYTADQRLHVFVVDVPDPAAEPVPGVPAAVQLTTADTDHAHPRATPDGTGVTVVAALHDGRDDDLRVGAHLLRLPRDGAGAGVEELVGPGSDLEVADVLVTASGTVFLLAQPLDARGLDTAGRSTGLYVLRDGRPHLLTDLETVDLGESTLDEGEPAGAVPDAVLVQDRTRGTAALLRVDAAGALTRLTSGPVEVTGAAAAGGTLVVALRDPGTAGDVAVVEAGGLRRLTDLSAPLRAAGVVTPHEVVVAARDGRPVHGWVLLPDASPGAPPPPTVLLIHGGPYAQYTGSLFDEAQVLAAAGYAVVMGNPRGSAGYGQAFSRSIAGAMGTVDASDVLDLLDGAVREHGLDPARVGIMGGSYGGYLTAWTTAHDHRFAAAIVERGYLDAELFVGTSDIGSWFSEQYVGEDPAQQRARSPQSVAHLTRTPTLVIHSEQDLRCPLSQAQRYFLTLRRAGVPAELLVFPGEDHELTRSGRPRHRRQRFDAVLEWWARHLPVG
ncbi:S9 family peptidase [Kineococcus rubinsiae]|uniref:S9 family peptidase n=1 Tax=Kineococcus rubinsiae TaxID=2609562 RepID=UPI00143084EB|nr:S9 family peptidase [Kineococcus rubinsiae]NIZ91336.1 S9 family peptidase [Kineococcus rubinsiae]